MTTGSLPGAQASTELRRLQALTLLAGVVVVASLQLLLWDHVADDAYITFRYVERLVDGRGLTFNDGERVEGFSHPLWVLLLGLGVSLSGGAVADVARTLGVVSTLATCLCFVALPAHDAERRATVVAAVATGLLLVFPGTHVYSSAGLETSFLGLLLTAGVLAGARGQPRAAAVAFGLAGVTRPEGLAYGLLWLGFTEWGRGPETNGRDRWRRATRFAVVLAPALVYEAFRAVYFGHWAPNTFWAKPPGTFGGLLGLDYLWPPIVAAGGPVGLALLVLVRGRGASARFERHAVGPIAASVAFVLYAWGDWMPFSRFFVPVWPLVSLVLAGRLLDLSERLPSERRWLAPPGAAVLLVVLLGLCALGAYGAEVARYAANRGLAATLLRGSDQIAVGEWLSANLPAGSTVVTTRLGGMSYAAPELIFWDERGLTDREQARWIARGRPGGEAASPVYGRVPDAVAALAVPAPWSYTESAFLTTFLDSGYRRVATFPQGSFGEVHVWLRRDVDR